MGNRLLDRVQLKSEHFVEEGLHYLSVVVVDLFSSNRVILVPVKLLLTENCCYLRVKRKHLHALLSTNC